MYFFIEKSLAQFAKIIFDNIKLYSCFVTDPRTYKKITTFIPRYTSFEPFTTASLLLSLLLLHPSSPSCHHIPELDESSRIQQLRQQQSLLVGVI